MSVESMELVIFADNDEGFYRRRISPVRKNLSKKYLAGKYDHNLAVKLWKYVADDAAKLYAIEGGDVRDWNRIFSVSDRNEAAREMADNWLADMEGGNFEGVAPENYARRKNPAQQLFPNPIEKETLLRPAEIDRDGDGSFHVQHRFPNGVWNTVARFVEYDEAVLYAKSLAKRADTKAMTWRVARDGFV